jgi:hypothetical protein
MVKKIYNYFRYLKLNKLKLKPKQSKNKVVLIEFFDTKAFGVSGSFFAHTLSKIHDAKIILYYPSFQNFKQLIIYSFNNLNPFSNLKVFKSFSNDVVIPQKKKINESFYLKNLKKITSNQKLVNFKYRNIQIGDLIYDEFLARYNLPTIDIKTKEFKFFFKECLELIYFWENYIKDNKVKSIVTSHSVYIMGLIARLGISFRIPVYVIGPHSHYKLTKNKFIKWANQHEYHKQFIRQPKNFRAKIMSDSKNNIDRRLKGKPDFRYKFARKINPVFSSTKVKPKLKKNKKKLNILIAAHCFMDAPHVYGNFIFYDFKEWLNFLGNLSEQKKLKEKYNWFIKIHPALYDRNVEHFKSILKRYPKFSLLKKFDTHNYLINDVGIDVVLTINGSVAHEYPLFKIPVVNAGPNPHEGYSFTKTAKSKSEYRKIIFNLKNLKVNKNVNREIYECYGMHHLIEYYFFKNMNIDLKDWNTFNVTSKFIDNYTQKLYDKKVEIYKEFILSKNRRLVDFDYSLELLP